MARKGAAHELPVDHEEVITRRRRRIPLPTNEAEFPLDIWLAQQAGVPTVQRITINKRISGGKYARLADGTLEPPFDLDVAGFFKKNGDGDYWFRVLGQNATSGRTEYVAQRYESILGYGGGDQAPAAAGNGKLNAMDVLAQAIETKRMAYVSKLLDKEIAGLDGPAPASAMVAAGEDFDLQLDRFAKIAVLMHKGGGGGSKLEEVFATWVPKLFEKIIPGAAEPAERSLAGLEKMLDFADRLSSRNGPADFPDMSTLLVLGVLGMMGNPQVQAMVNQLLGRVVPGVRVAAPTAGAHARPTPAAEPAAVPAAATSSPTEPTAAAAPSSEESAVVVLRGFVWPMIRRAIELESESFESYADVIDNHLEGFLDHWAAMDLETALAYVAPLDPEYIGRPQARAWLSRFHAYLVENPPDAASQPPADSGGAPSPA